jgi:hypothetical protein
MTDGDRKTPKFFYDYLGLYTHVAGLGGAGIRSNIELAVFVKLLLQV